MGGNTHPVFLLFLSSPEVSRKKSAHGSGHSIISVLQGLLLAVGFGKSRTVEWQHQPQQLKWTPVALLLCGRLVGATLPMCAGN